MSRLFLMRHAEAGVGVPDSERGLTELGREQAQSVGAVLKRMRAPRAPIRCSPARRCLETAGLIGQGETQVDPRLALNRPVRELLDLVGESTADTLLVGHQPELQALLAALLPECTSLPLALPPASLLGLRRQGDRSVLVALYLEAGEAAGLQAGVRARGNR